MDVTSVAGLPEEVFEAADARFRAAAQEKEEDFATVFQSAMDMVEETSDLQNQADSAAIQFALGESDNTHDLLIAQSKANMALQYTVAVKDRVIDAYREIMQMQI